MVDKQQRLHEIILDLANINTQVNSKNIDDYINKLQEVYQDNFRHMYSDVFSTITLIDESDSYALDQLANNIRMIRQRIIDQNDKYSPTFCKQVTKLYDHTNLDISRIRYTQKVAENWNKKMLQDNKDLKGELQSLATKAESVQKDNITILGIFSSIVITFVAGMVISSSVLNNIDKVSIYRLTFIIIMMALFLFNLVHLLLDFLRKIHFQGLFADNVLDTGETKHSVILSVNIVLFFMLLADIILWGIYWYRATGYHDFFGY